MATGLEGRLELVRVAEREGFVCPGGYLLNPTFQEYNPVSVKNANLFIGEICLVQFDLELRRPGNQKPIANFISQESSFSDSFHGLAPEEFILCAHWNPEWAYGKIPTLDQINKYFSTPKMGSAVYCKGETKIIITPHNPKTIKRSFRRLIPDELPDPKRYARVILVDNEEDWFSVGTQARKKGINTIKLQRYQHRTLNLPDNIK